MKPLFTARKIISTRKQTLMHASTKLLLLLWLPASLFAKDPKLAPAVKPPPPPPVPAAEVVLREIRYEGKLSDTEARFVAELDLESFNKTEASVPLFEGEVAVLPLRSCSSMPSPAACAVTEAIAALGPAKDIWRTFSVRWILATKSSLNW